MATAPAGCWLDSGIEQTATGRGQRQLAAALKVTLHALEWSMQRGGKPGAGMALRAARLAEVPVEDMLAGQWPVPRACPHCGRL